MSDNQSTLPLDELTVLLVEPSPTQHKIIVDHLYDSGIHHIDWVQTGQEALDKMQSKPCDITISAMHLRDITGTELIQKMRDTPSLSEIPFMLISSETHYRYLEPIRQAGTIALLPKPFNQEQLNTALNSALLYFSSSELQTSGVDVHQLNTLIVDDSITSLNHITRILSNMGFSKITHAHNGREAVNLITNESYDLIVTDYNMPEMNGDELIEYIRTKSNQPNIPILMVSSVSDENRIANIQKSGVSAICNKPFDVNTVKQILVNILH